MAKWHVSPHDGVARKCSATIKNCEYAHAENEAAAYALNETIMAEEGYDAFSTIQKLENHNDPSLNNQFIGRDYEELRNVQRVYIEDYRKLEENIEQLKKERKPGDMLHKSTLDEIKKEETRKENTLKVINKVGYAIDLADGTRPREVQSIQYAEEKFNHVKMYLENETGSMGTHGEKLLEAMNNSRNKEDTLQVINKYVNSPESDNKVASKFAIIKNLIEDDNNWD